MLSTIELTTKANRIVSNYCKGFIEPGKIQDMYDELKEIGITTGLLYGDPSEKPISCEWYINNEEVENSLFVYSTYKSSRTNRVEFTIYFS